MNEIIYKVLLREFNGIESDYSIHAIANDIEAALNESAKLSTNTAKGCVEPTKPPAVSNPCCDACGNGLDEDNYVHLCSDCYESVLE